MYCVCSCLRLQKDCMTGCAKWINHQDFSSPPLPLLPPQEELQKRPKISSLLSNLVNYDPVQPNTITKRSKKKKKKVSPKPRPL